MRVQTNINGMTTTSTFNEGDCYSLVNLRKKNGTLHPVTPRMVEFELQDKYDIYFVHSFNDYENWIGIKNSESGGSDVYWIASKNIDSGNYNVFDEPVFILNTGTTVADEVISVEQIGNTLSLITGNSILYLLYSDLNYETLGAIPEIQPISWFNYGYYYNKQFSDEYSTLTSDDINSATIGLFNLFKNDIYDKVNGCLFDAHLMVFAFRLYDGSYIKQTSPVLLCGNLLQTAFAIFSFNSNISFNISNSGIGINSNKIYLEFDLSYLNSWSDIIKSVDIFISNGLGKSAESNFIPETDIVNHFNASAGLMVDGFNLMNDDSLMINNIKSNANFYLIDSIPIGTVSQYINDSALNTMFCFPNKSVLDNLDILIDQQTLPVDSFSHHSITGNVSYAYNNRLHLAQIKTTLFKGFDINFFTLSKIFLGESYFGVGYVKDIDGNIIRHDDNPVTDVRFNGFIMGDFLRNAYGILIEVYLKINGQTDIVYAEANINDDFWLNPYFSYPDPSAFKVQFYVINSDGTGYIIQEYQLTSSEYINNSFYINSVVVDNFVEVSPLNMLEVANPPSEIDIPDTMPSYVEENKLKVSAINDPFIFPNETTYLVSDGVILNMASVAIRISEGQFGQYPLYVFTNKGIYSMATGSGDVVYSQEAAPTSYEVPINSVICITPFGVIFISSRGVCMIIGQNVELLTYPLQQYPKELNIQSTPELDSLLLNYGKNALTDYLKGIEFIIYNPHENELIIIDKDSSFNFVMNFDSKQFYLSTEKIDHIVENTFPELIVIDGYNVKNYAQSGSNSAYVSLVTRPLIFGTTDLKNLERMFFRATLYNPIESVILNYYSIDKINFFALKGYNITQGNRKDFDMGLHSRSKYRQFLFAFAGTLDEKSELEYLETEIVQEYNNTKMR